MLKRFGTLIFLVVTLSSCSSDESEPPVVVEPPPEPSGFAIEAPDSVTYGEIFQLNVNFVESNDATVAAVEADIPLYNASTEGNTYTFVAPSLSLGASQFTVTVNASDGESQEKTIQVIDDTDMTLLSGLTRRYAFTSSNIDKYSIYQFDENGVPLYTKSDGTTAYFPSQIAQVAQSYYTKLSTGNYTAEEEADFIAQVSWLRDNCQSVEPYKFCSWQATFELPAYRLPDNWTSSMGQGFGISVLISAYAWTRDETYLDVAKDALLAFAYPVAMKGVVADYDGVPWYEEYGSETDPAHVLNGFLFALAGVYDAFELMGSNTAKQYFDIGADSLAQRIDRFDLGFGSYYDDSHLEQVAIAKGSVGDHYHELHIFQLAWLYNRVPLEPIIAAAEKFLEYDTGGLHSYPLFFENSIKILDIEPSDTVDPSRYGPDLLTDSNWTWKRFWSSNEPIQSLQITLNNSNEDQAPIEMTAIRITGLDETDVPENIDLYSCTGEQRILVQANINAADHQTTGMFFDAEGYLSYTSVLTLPEPIELPCNNVELVITPARDDNYSRFRELNIHMKQPRIMEDILGEYPVQ
ncbi:MAG TPA: D-glucuronyl C5-epimerase family protein [Pseudidiomarina sp.]|nr:D-glucuronyl C5-epimerase family protein [Pseudidiomarina sp.]